MEEVGVGKPEDGCKPPEGSQSLTPAPFFREGALLPRLRKSCLEPSSMAGCDGCFFFDLEDRLSRDSRFLNIIVDPRVTKTFLPISASKSSSSSDTSVKAEMSQLPKLTMLICLRSVVDLEDAETFFGVVVFDGFV